MSRLPPGSSFLPQFFTPVPVRIAHGVLLGVGLAWLAVAMWRDTGSARHLGHRGASQPQHEQ